MALECKAVLHWLPVPWASGLPVAIQCAWNLDPSVHWNATGEIILVASVLPVVFQGSSSGLPVDRKWDGSVKHYPISMFPGNSLQRQDTSPHSHYKQKQNIVFLVVTCLCCITKLNFPHSYQFLRSYLQIIFLREPRGISQYHPEHSPVHTTSLPGSPWLNRCSRNAIAKEGPWNDVNVLLL